MRIVALVALMGLGCRGPVPLEPDLKTAGDSAPVAVAAGTLHLDHAAFTTMSPMLPIAHILDYFYAVGIGANASVPVALPVGTTLNRIQARLYGDRDGLGEFEARSVDVVLWREGLGPCPVVGSDINGPVILPRCPVLWTGIIMGPDGWRDPDGWQIKEMVGAGTIEAGHTYTVQATLASVDAPSPQSLRVSWVDVDYNDGLPAPIAVRTPLPARLRAMALRGAPVPAIPDGLSSPTP